MVTHHDVSERKACQLVGLSRTGYRHQCADKADGVLRTRLKELATSYPRYGYLLLHGLLRNESLVINKKRTYRIYTEEKLQVRTKKRKKLQRARIPMSVPSGVNERWSMDFVSDQLFNGRRFRVLNIVDEYSREMIGQLVSVSISGCRVARFLNELAETRPLPKSIVCDNGTEFTSKAMFFWSGENNVKLDFIQPGKPTQNAFIESLNGKFRDNCLSLHWFKSMEDAKEKIDTWRNDYNNVRPHSSLNYMTPVAFANKAA
jgi:putative transposase